MSFSGKPTTFVEQAIENDGFWPDLSVAEFQKGYRLPAEYLVEMLAADLTMAMVEVNTDLAKVKARWQGAGVSNVESADTTVLPERTFQAATYKRAVYSRAKASLLTQFATVNRRESAENVGKELPERSETFLAFSQAAVRSLQGRGRITAALL
ncbi:Prophage PSPPH06, putative head completion/stabilization protein [Pseudomonas syringae pv. coriandricola]|uniref:Prophage PSPPH06, putative head completion/stabilization protein n=1 Tax=Pseudomonas syringae pv. coriandricola TaxID=264453 RepID=A0A3M4U0L1_9PSED|nr:MULTISPECIES: head completion/stabilization protein [Pseudomonas syringae group]RMN99174.1 Prophage PSPPH06, putative head completion/stabilization protein [Pseudomonas coronafaciens pv. coronafaciens]RMR33074.1 Prophage PSPPH06, putative head completion/stabilization protein [Pseudomonas syringae pv. coriandricola]RMU09753.1 Prophage PSPPH06, putative head completion/stabilization protein [Pseudomonas syringae pv. coriandricola]RMV66974.1 Prophage PSPPH06, putative head completion/stabiliza